MDNYNSKIKKINTMLVIVIMFAVVTRVWANISIHECKKDKDTIDIVTTAQPSLRSIQSNLVHMESAQQSTLFMINQKLEIENFKLNMELEELRDRLKELEGKDDVAKERQRVSEAPSRSGNIVKIPQHREIKTYMGHDAITNKSSDQWKFQQRDDLYFCPDTGLQKLDDYFVVAVGTGVAENIGDKLEVKLDTGNTFKAVVGDFKANHHTDNNNIVHSDGSVVEFIVNKSQLEPAIRKNNVQSSEVYDFKGLVKEIKRLD